MTTLFKRVLLSISRTTTLFKRSLFQIYQMPTLFKIVLFSVYQTTTPLKIVLFSILSKTALFKRVLLERVFFCQKRYFSKEYSLTLTTGPPWWSGKGGGGGGFHFLYGKVCITQGYTLTMIVYVLRVITLMSKLIEAHPNFIQPWYAD